MIAPGVAAAALLAPAISIDDYVITSFNAGQTQTFPLFIFGDAPGRAARVQRAGHPALVIVLILMRSTSCCSGAWRPGRSAATCSTSPSRRRSSPHVARRRTGFVFDERCFGHRTGPAGRPGSRRRCSTARAPRGDVPRARGLRRPAPPRAAAGLERPAHRARARPRRQPRPAGAHRAAVTTCLDHEAWIGPGTGAAALLAVGGMLEAVGAVISGEIAQRVRARAGPRPPRLGGAADGLLPLQRDRGRGGAGRAALCGRVAILDWDVHHGNGTEAIFRDAPWS